MERRQSRLLNADEVAQEIADWMADAFDRIGAGDLDESVLSVALRGSMVRLEVRVIQRD